MKMVILKSAVVRILEGGVEKAVECKKGQVVEVSDEDEKKILELIRAGIAYPSLGRGAPIPIGPRDRASWRRK